MKLGAAALCSLLLLGVLFAVRPAPSASAQETANEVCVTGTYVAGVCEVRTTSVPDCEPDACAIDVARPSVPRTEPATQGPESCPTGSRGTPQTQCYIYVAKGPDGCPRFSVAGTDGHCAQLVANRAGTYGCEDGGRLSIVGSNQTCVFENDPVVGLCPDNAEPFNGRCVDFAVEGLSASCGLRNEDLLALHCIEPSSVTVDGPDACAPGTQFVADACVVPSGGLVAEPCSYPTAFDVDAFAGDLCLASLEPVVASCAPGYSRDSSLEGRSSLDNCFRFVPADDTANGTARCDTGSLTTDSTQCFVPATLNATNLAACAEGTIDQTGTACFRYEPAQPGPLRCPQGAEGPTSACYFDVTPVRCSVGTLSLLRDLCLIVTDQLPVTGDPVCPVSSTVFLDGEFCYAVVTPPSPGVCPAGSILQDGQCRRSVPFRPGPLMCTNASHFVIEGQCWTAVPPDAPDGSCPDQAAFEAGTGRCLQPTDAVVSYYFCSDDSAILVAATCAINSGTPTSTLCPAGFSINAAGTGCVRVEAAVAGAAQCPTQSLGTVGNCYVDVTPRGCNEGTQADSVCLILAAPPVPTEGECAISSTVFLDGEFCYSLVERDGAGNCPASAIEQQGECRRPVAIRPGPRVCTDPAHAYIDGQCFEQVPVDVPSGPCPLGSQLFAATGECRQPVADTTYSCASADAVQVGVTSCVRSADFISQPLPDSYFCESGDRTIIGVGPDSVICIVGTPVFDPGSVCADGQLLGRSCVWSEPFTNVVCPADFSPIEDGLLCRGVLAGNTVYSCTGFGDILNLAGASAGCVKPTGPQPGECPGITRNGQCYAFVDHSLVCAPGGCVVSSPAEPAAPLAARGDIDCNSQINLRDALMLARTLADPAIARLTLCTSANATDSIRITAADVAQDGTIDARDTKRLLQCLVDGTVGACVQP